jgi:hypothetical protein
MNAYATNHPLTWCIATILLSVLLCAAQLYILIEAFGWWTLPILAVGNTAAFLYRHKRRPSQLLSIAAFSITLYALYIVVLS